MFELKARKPNMFEFKFKGKKYGIPKADSLPFAMFMGIRKKMAESDNPEELGFDEIMSLFETYIPDVMKAIDAEQAKELFMAYIASGDVPVGESLPSSD